MKKVEPKKSLSEQTYNIIKESITSGNLSDGESLPEEKLAKKLGVSRTPLRDALNRLAAEGLVVQKQGAPSEVAGFSKERSLEYMELRKLLEVYNIEKIIGSVTEDVINELEKNLEDQLLAIKQGTYNDFIDQDRQFHLLLASVNQNSELRKVIHRMNTGVNRAFILLSKTVVQSAEEAYDEHLEIFEVIKEKDIETAKVKMNVHLDNVKERFLRYGT
ncbi:MAG TPA: GntR family transcriptional regulator [Pseudogracilibacillus sp.]|nr:GntR family transcriptional regulator [Pseudogracilibacillus sp.]